MSEIPKQTASQPPTQRVTLDTLRLDSGPGSDVGPNAPMYAFFQLFRTAQIHAIDNQALVRPVKAMADLSATLIAREGRLSLQSQDRALFVNSTKLKLSSDEYELANGIFDFFQERGMGGFTLEGALNEEAVRQLLMVLVYAPPQKRTFEGINEGIRQAGLPFRINKPLGTGRKTDAEVVLERRSYTFFTYSKLVVLFRTLLAEQKANNSKRQFLLKKIARTTQALVDICLEDDHTFIGVSAVKSGDAYSSHHAANTTILAIALGEKIGLSKVELADLGLAALYHDIGLRTCPPEVLEKPGPLAAAERAMIEQHPVRSVEFLLEERKFTRSALSRLVVAFEHHRPYAGTGGGRRPDLYTRIVTIAAVYDALTTKRPWREAHLPDEALGMMMKESGARFDPALLKIFVNTMGLYPIGTLVRLDSSEFGVVVYGGGEADRVSRPIVALLDRNGQPTKTVDLMEQAGGRYLRSVVCSEDPAKYGLQTSGIVAASAGMAG